MTVRKKGFTLSELMVTIVLFGIFSTTLLTMLTLSLRYMTKANTSINSQKTVATISDCMTNEIKTALINGTSNGYKYVTPTPPPAPTAFLDPPTNITTDNRNKSNQVKFSAINAKNFDITTYDPSSTSATMLDTTNSNNFQTVRYYVSGDQKSIHREVTRYDPTLGNTVTVDTTIGESEIGTFTLSSELISSDLIKITITEFKGAMPVNLLSRQVFVPSK